VDFIAAGKAPRSGADAVKACYLMANAPARDYEYALHRGLAAGVTRYHQQ
jgi:hypothetical protein